MSTLGLKKREIMDQTEKQSELHEETLSSANTDGQKEKLAQRRRFIRLGSVGVPVVATLASKSAFAWHCKSPSAWGSEIINPNTSLKINAGHQRYPDETWYITNWRDNVARAAAGYGGKPWDVLKSKSSLKLNAPVSATVKKSFDYSLVTVAELIAAVPGIKIMASPSRKVKELLTNGTNLEKSTLVAQLNFCLLSPLSANELESCLNSSALQKMAMGTYTPAGINQTWDANKITKYLYENYIAR
jgi:hypothetical protein